VVENARLNEEKGEVQKAVVRRCMHQIRRAEYHCLLYAIKALVELSIPFLLILITKPH